jgi:hypothetical protein
VPRRVAISRLAAIPCTTVALHCNNRTKLLQCEIQDQKKETNATKKYYLLQHPNKATATTEQSAMREATPGKKRD